MCGIIAIKGKNDFSDAILQKMLKSLERRGPDEQKFVRIEDVILGQTRLSIVDLSSGNQPMKDNDLPITIVFNGEIYDYKDLKSNLENKGHIFRTNSDTEVILKTYIEYGKDCLNYLDGMFAFIIYDQRTDELFFARDRFGKKPFYYTFINESLVCASEIKAIFETEKIKGIINKEALDDYLKYGYIGPDKTIYSNILTLLPAHAGIYKNGKIKSWQYWNLKKDEIKVTYKEAKEQIKRLFDESVRKRMVADVEIGSFLSGGVDSTLTTLYAQKYSSFPIKTFSVSYGGSKDESIYASQASKQIGTHHHSLPISAQFSEELEKVITYMDEPHADNSNFPQHLISKLASTKVKVALTGDGADELFMGYGWYQKKMHIPRWRLDLLFIDAFSIQQKMISFFNKKQRFELLKGFNNKNDNFIKKIISKSKNSIQKINDFDIKYYLPGQLLTKIDRTSMMNSLEIRSPFLDTKLAEYVYNLPIEFKISKNENKIILKEILADIFPKEFVYRRKQGFGAPVKDWLKQDGMKSLINEILIKKDSIIYRYINKKSVQKIIEEFESNKSNSEFRLWIILCLYLWFKKSEKNLI